MREFTKLPVMKIHIKKAEAELRHRQLRRQYLYNPPEKATLFGASNRTRDRPRSPRCSRLARARIVTIKWEGTF